MIRITLLFVVLCTSCHINATPFNDLMINTEGGQLRGIEERTRTTDERYFSWKGIPYAEPPVGPLRFNDPVPHRGWTGVRDASSHGPNCATIGLISDKLGDEDCLFLNVFTQSVIDKRPVMVWVHGGGFIIGSGDDDRHGPEFYVTEDVVYVTLNYRLGILGFLSTGDRHAPGNYGLKDVVLALQWVKRNIINFGGDPDNITLFGQSAGGVAVHLILLSPMVPDGLFHRAIVQSGTGLSSWAINSDPALNAYNLADQLGVSYWDNEDLVAKLRELPGSVLMNTTPGPLDMEITRGIVSAFTYAPVVEPTDYTGAKLLPRHPREIMKSGDFKDIPLIIGYTDEESLFMIREQILDGSVRDIVNGNRQLVVPTTLWNVDPNSADGRAIADELWSYYLNNEQLTQDNRYEWSQLNSDIHFTWGTDQTVRLHLQQKNSPIYYYRFSFDGSLNFLKRRLLLTAFPGAMHGDELGYMFDSSNLPILPTNHALVVRRRFNRMWTDFAKYGTPTPVTDPLITTTWPRVTNNLEFMDIGHDLVVGNNPFGSRMELFNRLVQNYVNN